MDVFSLKAAITLDSSEYDRGLKDAEARTSRFADVLKANLATDAIRAGFKGLVTTIKGAASAIGGLVKSSVNAYADYEQMVGGVKKLYGNMGQSLAEFVSEQQKLGKSAEQATADWHKLEEAQNLVLENAKQAYKTSGMSMNQYMETATSFSASLINSLKGDTIAAAQQTDKAMQAISDNFNTFGGDISMIQGAFQGFAKQNYTMLDNLKLGYGGTKTEMERLIADANEYAATIGEANNLTISSFSDVVTAIDLVQRKQQIAGTTEREAASTIAGSLGMLKSAWENLITGFSDSRADMGQLIDDVVKSAETAFENIFPVAEKALTGIAEFVGRISPIIEEKLPGLAQDILPKALNALSSLANSIFSALPSILQSAASVLPGVIDSIFSTIESVLPSAIDIGSQIITIIIDGITQNADKIIDGLFLAINSALDVFSSNNINKWALAGADIITYLLKGISQNADKITSGLLLIISTIASVLSENIDKWLDAGAQIIISILQGINSAIPKIVPVISQFISKAASSIIKNAPKILKAVRDVIKSVFTEIGKLDGVGGIVGKLGLAFAAIKLPQGLLGGLSAFTGQATSGFGGLLGVLTKFNDKTKDVEGSIGGFFSKLKTGVSNGMQNFNAQMEAGNASIGTFLSSMKGGLSGQFGSVTEKINGFSDKLSVASKGLLALGGGAVGIMGISDAMTKLGDETENTGLAIAELAGSTAASTASMVAAFGVPGGIIAGAVTALIGVFKGLIDTIQKVNAKAAGQAIHDALVTPGGVSLDTINQKYVDMIGTITSGSEQFAAKLGEISSARKPIEDTAFSLGMISNAVTTGAATLDEKLPEIKEKFESLYNDTKSIMDKEYEAIVYGVTQSMSDSLAELGISVPGVVAQLRGIQTESEQTLDQLNESFNKLSDAYMNADNAFDKSRIGQQLQDVIDKMAAFQHVEVDQSVEKVEQLGNALDLSQYIGEDNALDVSKFSADMQALNEAAKSGVNNTKAIAEESKATMDDWLARAEALGQDTSDIDWESLYGANEEKKNSTLAAIRDTYQAEADEIQSALVEKIPDIIRNAQAEYKDLDPVKKALTSEAAVVSQALSEYQANTIKPAMEGLEDNFNTAFAGTGEHLETYAQDVMGNVMSNMFEFDNTGNISLASLKMSSDWESVFNNVAYNIPQYTGKVTEALAEVPEQAHEFGLGTIGGYDGGVSEGISSSTAPGELQNFEDELVKTVHDGALSFGSPSTTMHDFGVDTIVGFNEGLEEMVDTTPGIMEAWINSIAETVSDTLTSIITSFKDVGEKISEGIEKGLEKAKDKLKKSIVKPIKDALKQIEKQYSNYKAAGQKIIDNLKNGFTSKIADLVSKAKDIAEKIGKAFKDKDWKQIGQYITDGIKAGIEAGKSKVIEAAVEMAVAAYEAAKEALEISSPSKKMKELGKWLAYGLAEGIAKNEDEAVQESEEMANKVLSEAQRILDGYKDFHAVSLKDEIYYWKQVKAQLQEGTEAYATTLKTIKELRAQLSERKYTVGSLETNYGEDNFSGFMADSLNDLIVYKNALKKNGMKRADRDSAIISAAGQRLENFKVFNEMTIEEEKQFWEVILSNVKKGSQAWYDISAKIKALDEEIAEESTRAAEEAAKTAEQLVKDFYAAAEKIEEERGNRIKALNQKYEKYYSEREKLDNNYHRNLENLNNKEIQDIQKLEDAYENSVNSRKNSIMGMTNLFDRTAYGQTWSKEYLQETLAQQVEALEDWDKELDNLGSRLGTDNPLVEELSNMGVGSLFTLKEINSMSDAELAEYSKMYAKKMQVAEQRARDDNAGLRRQTNAEIANIRADYEKQRGELYDQYQADLKALEESLKETDENILKEVNETFLKTNESYAAEYEKINKDADTEMTALENQFRSDLTQLTSTCKTKGREVGNGMTNGMKKGIEENKSSVINAAVSVAVEAYRAACAALGVASPSKKFKYIGKMTAQGFIEGIRGMSGEISKATKDTFDVGADVAKTFTVDDRAAASRGGFVQNLTVNAPQALDPSEVARQTRIMNQQMVLALRGVG